MDVYWHSFGLAFAFFVTPQAFQGIPGNDQNTSPTNQKTARSMLERTSLLMFYGSWKHLKSFSGNSFVIIFSLGYLLTYLVKRLEFNTTMFEKITAKHCLPFLGIPMTWNHLVTVSKCESFYVFSWSRYISLHMMHILTDL